MSMNQQPTALDWLARVALSSPNPDARRMARFAMSEWQRLSDSWKTRNVKTRRSLWDLLAGVFECHQNITHHKLMTEVVSGRDKFYFPVFKEACGRRAKSYKGTGAIEACIPVGSERLPQTTKWGNTVCKT